MSARFVWLRLLLCVALVFNGATSAMASVQMMQLHAQAEDAVGSAGTHADAMAESTLPCHHGEQAPQESTAPAKTRHPATPDCCKSDTCTCACVSPVVAMVPTLASHDVPMADAGNIRPLALGHAAPALPHLIRPPIG